MRIHKYMAMCGVASRRKSEKIVEAGRVQVNGQVITNLGYQLTDTDTVMVDGQVIHLEEKKVYIMLNKPLDCVTTASDQFDRKTVLDYVDVKERVYPVGRLDYNTTGLLLLTNDGDLAYKITHPSHEVKKTYIAKVKGQPSEEALERFRSGLLIEDKMTSKAHVKIVKKAYESILEIQIHEGRNRQVRKMCEAINHPVITLKRIAVGQLKLDVELASYRHLTDKEVEYLMRSYD